MDPRLLAQLTEVVECGSLRKAAERLNVTAPTLTRNIRIIEDKVGSPVLERSSTGVIPTSVGQQLADVGRNVTECSAKADEIVSRWRLGLGRELRVGAGSLITSSILSGFLVQAMTRKPSYPIAVRTTAAPRVVSQVISGEFDIGLAITNSDALVGEVHQQNLMCDQVAIFASPSNPLARKRGPVTAQELSEQTWLNVGAQAVTFSDVDALIKQHGVVKKSALFDSAGSIEMSIKIVHETDAIIVLPRKLAMLTMFTPALAEIQVEFDLPKRDVALYIMQENRHKPDVVDFVTKLAGYVDDCTRDLN